MKAKISPRIELEGRTPLQDVIPLSTPFILFVDPSNVCNFNCKFCPTGHQDLMKKIGRVKCYMEFDLYKKIIDDLSEFENPIKVLRMYKEGEPMLNPNFVGMVRYAKYKGIKYIDTTTNGFLINKKRMKPIIDAGLDKINISVNGLSDEQFLKFARVRVDFNKYVQNIKDLYEIKGNCEIVIKTTGDYLTEEDKNKFYNIFNDYCDRIFIENTANCWPEFDVEVNTGIKISKEKGIYNQQINEVRTCPYIFYQMCINSDGTVSVCFLDWEHKCIIGDTKIQTLKEIWNSIGTKFYQITNLEGNRNDLTLCKNCGQLKYGQPDDIDKYAEVLKEKCLKEWYK